MRRAPFASSLTRLGTAAAALALVVGLAACQPEPEIAPSPTASVEIAGDFGVRPTVTFPETYTVTEASTAVLTEGAGTPVVEGQAVLLDYYAVDAVTHEAVADTFATLPEIRKATVESLGEALHDLVIGVPVGSRLERIELGTAARPNPHVIVVDILPIRAVGTVTAPLPGTPAVTLADTGEPTVTIPPTDPPTSGTTSVLLKGSGSQVSPDQTVIIQFTATRWGDATLTESTWAEGPRSVPLSELPEGLRAGLVEQTVGSQVVIVVPPTEGDASNTLVYVVDILATSDISLTATPTAEPVPEEVPEEVPVAPEPAPAEG